MKKAKAARVPVLENAFEVNLPKLMRAVKETSDCRVVLDDGDVRTVAVLAETRLAVFLGARHWVVDIVSVQCLQGRLRPLLRCPRAHEGNFQSLYFRGEELACRHCHVLRYRTNVAATATERARIARRKLLSQMGGAFDTDVPDRRQGRWRKKHARLAIQLGILTKVHYVQLKAYLTRTRNAGHAPPS
ncbi:MAG: hypothetical protein RR804_01345 [Massilia sp.]